MDENLLTAFYVDLTSRGPSAAEKKLYVGRPASEVYDEIRNGQEHKNFEFERQKAQAVIQGLERERDENSYPRINAATLGLGLPTSASATDIAKAIDQLKSGGGGGYEPLGQPVFVKKK